MWVEKFENCTEKERLLLLAQKLFLSFSALRAGWFGESHATRVLKQVLGVGDSFVKDRICQLYHCLNSFLPL